MIRGFCVELQQFLSNQQKETERGPGPKLGPVTQVYKAPVALCSLSDKVINVGHMKWSFEGDMMGKSSCTASVRLGRVQGCQDSGDTPTDCKKNNVQRHDGAPNGLSLLTSSKAPDYRTRDLLRIDDT
mmetsp:Transcript_15899/g.32634  ORF Transcript_15899/g.32634 Transcript_15899/m.32634 type:complete len:128 (-) Transcript_15899:1-384(-)